MARKLSKQKAGFIISLKKKKVRDEAKLFVIEGDKIVKEFLSAGMPVRILYAKPEFIGSLPEYVTGMISEVESVSFEDLKHISSLKTPHNALAVVTMPDTKPDLSAFNTGISVVLDMVQDPGNLGTIIRAAAWFGIGDIYCSRDCADVFNPKVIQASMGALMHVNVFYTDLLNLLGLAAGRQIRIYGAMMEGNPVYEYDIGESGIIILGNESKGISEELIPFITDRIMIPRFTTALFGIDSLNVGMAASVIFSEFARRRRQF